MKKFFKEFKAFISRGNVLDMAVGVIIGSAFSAIVTAFTNNIIRPLINLIIKAIIGDSEISAYTYLWKEYTVDAAGNKVLDPATSIYIDWGSFISAIINFLLIAFVLFMIVKAFNKVRNAAQLMKDVKAKKEKGLKLTKREEKLYKQLLEQEAKEAEEKAKAEEAARLEALKLTREEQILVEIRDLLKERK